jgi:transaldolase
LFLAFLSADWPNHSPLPLQLVEFGKQILALIPGRVSTEVDASLSFDTKATVKKVRFCRACVCRTGISSLIRWPHPSLHRPRQAHELIALYKSVGIEKERVLIKIAATWEGIQAARQLEKEDGIHCNLTLLFGFGQAVACAEASVTLISPFVGRILDWYKKSTGKTYEGDEGKLPFPCPSAAAAQRADYLPFLPSDPGVISVKKIFNYYKQHDYDTIVMGASFVLLSLQSPSHFLSCFSRLSSNLTLPALAILPSFRNVGEIKSLAGVDFLTIAPALLEELKNSTEPVPKKLASETAKKDEPIAKVSYIDNEPAFRWELLQDSMAWEQLHSGIKKFAVDCDALKEVLKSKLQ